MQMEQSFLESQQISFPNNDHLAPSTHQVSVFTETGHESPSNHIGDNTNLWQHRVRSSSTTERDVSVLDWLCDSWNWLAVLKRNSCDLYLLSLLVFCLWRHSLDAVGRTRRRYRKTDQQFLGTDRYASSTSSSTPSQSSPHDHRSLCQSIPLLLDTESGLKKSLSRIGQEEQVELLLNRFIRLEEHVSGTSRWATKQLLQHSVIWYEESLFSDGEVGVGKVLLRGVLESDRPIWTQCFNLQDCFRQNTIGTMWPAAT